MAEETFTISRIELRRVLVLFGVTEKDIASILSSMEKSHRHVNVITFAAVLEKAGLSKEKVENIFRRIGMNDITIHDTMNMIDEQRISAETGRVYAIDLEG